MRTDPKQKQLAYIDSLVREARLSRLQLGEVVSFNDARAAIDRLLGTIPLRQKTRSAVFAALKNNRDWDRESLYEAVGVQSLAANGGATEADGQNALRLLNGPRHHEHEPVANRSFVNMLSDLELERMAQPDSERLYVAADPIIPPTPGAAPAVPQRRGRPGVQPRRPAVAIPEARPEPTRAPVNRPGRPGVAPTKAFAVGDAVPENADPLAVRFLTAFASAGMQIVPAWVREKEVA